MSEPAEATRPDAAGAKATGAAPGLRVGVVEVALLLALATIWGSSFMFIKIAVVEIPPATLTWLRVAMGALALLGYNAARGVALPRGARTWATLFACALLGNALPFTLIGWGEGFVDSGVAAIGMSVMPLCTLLLAHVFTHDERITPGRLAGLALGFVGVLALVGPDALAGAGENLVAQLAIIAAACSYAANAVLSRTLPKLAPTSLSAGVMLCATALAAPASLLLERPFAITPGWDEAAAALVLGVVGTGLATVVFFALIRRAGATFLALINYLIPILGVAFGAVLLAEDIPAPAFVALALVLLGLALTGAGTPRRARRGR